MHFGVKGVEVEVEGAEVEGCSSRLKGWRLRGCSLRLRGRGAEAGGILGVSTPHFLEDPKNGSCRGWE